MYIHIEGQSNDTLQTFTAFNSLCFLVIIVDLAFYEIRAKLYGILAILSAIGLFSWYCRVTDSSKSLPAVLPQVWLLHVHVCFPTYFYIHDRELQIGGST